MNVFQGGILASLLLAEAICEDRVLVEPECIEVLDLKMLGKLYHYLLNTSTSVADMAWKLAFGIIMDEGEHGDLIHSGEDILGTLGLHPDVWRPGAGRNRDHATMKQVSLPRELFSTYWQGWCARVGFPQDRCCNSAKLGLPESDCFDAMHTRERCCAGNRKAATRLYQIATQQKVWVQGRCSSSPPRKIFRITTQGARLLACERWQGKFPHLLPALPRHGTVINFEESSYEECEEGSLIAHNLKAVVISFGGDFGCISTQLDSLPLHAWQPPKWPLATHGAGAVGAICVPLRPRNSTIKDQKKLRAKLGETAIMSIGTIARRLIGSAVGEPGDSQRSLQDNYEDTKNTMANTEQYAARLDSAAYKGRCLVTPTHPPHFSHVALMIEAVRQLAQDAFEHWPTHVIIFDTSVDVDLFCREQVVVCRSAVVVRNPSQIEKLNTTFVPLVLSSKLVLVALDGLMKTQGESFEIVESIRWEHQRLAAREFQPYGPCATGWGQVHQGLKKIYGMLWAQQAIGCEISWVVDSESFPLRRFWFAEVFEAYLQSPWVQVQDFGSMLGCYGTAALIIQECAHLIVTHKLRLSPAGAYSYRASDFWIYENWRVRGFVQEIKAAWGEPFIEVWMRAPAHGEGLILPSWLHLRHADGAKPIEMPTERMNREKLVVLDIPTIVRSQMPSLYQAACMNGTIGSEARCSDDFSIVPLAMQALGLPESLDGLQAALADSTSSSTREFLQLLQLLDALPFFGAQGHGDALRLKALPALLPYWHRGISWCVSNCDWRQHAETLLYSQGLHQLHSDVLLAVPTYKAAHSEISGSISQQQLPVFGRNTSVIAVEAHTESLRFSCEQSLMDPSEKQSVGMGATQSSWLSWDRCLDIVQE